ncbi:unnamed protein product [Didymodactylos carnosus]|uniref:EGF-like domain-containing protein n=1 Tax=Didymodactylos carnosus TaxID=1234261 RepID=A0A814VMD0_9BILA|nr:unnamed protein product [Didymodactylos carnosus]CAF1190819.1 unnamed protein product [Didymodactylos carnosus]CAF3860141.1 unnamed protein product [Didymodactylos carnosus]CAF3955066.1 unnamed protein product [Didymodactylos carnosus]
MLPSVNMDNFTAMNTTLFPYSQLAPVNSPCSSSPCNGEKCINIFAASTYYCVCHNGAYSRNCERSWCERDDTMETCVGGYPPSEIPKVFEGCQTFEDNSALKFICICRRPKLANRTVGQLWYGSSCVGTIFETPCATANGEEKFPLGHTDKGYIQCTANKTLYSIESCTINYVWNHKAKGCVRSKENQHKNDQDKLRNPTVDV